MRVISLLPGATDTIVALGGTDLLVGVSHACDAPASIGRVTAPAIDAAAASGAIDAAVRDAAAAGRPLFSLDNALIASLRPDLIVTQALCDVCAVSESDVRLLAAGMSPAPRVVSVSGSTFEDVFTDIATIAAASGLDGEADELLAGLRHRTRAVHGTLKAARAPRPRVAVIEWTEPMFAGGHWIPEQVARAGGVDVLAKAGAHSVIVGSDQVRDAKPDIVIVAPCGFRIERAEGEAARLLRAHPWLATVQLWAIDANRLTSRPGPQLVNGIEVMARVFAPTLFTPGDPSLARRVGRGRATTVV
jgi:iron complex transport system substrate-binding protein